MTLSLTLREINAERFCIQRLGFGSTHHRSHQQSGQCVCVCSAHCVVSYTRASQCPQYRTRLVFIVLMILITHPLELALTRVGSLCDCASVCVSIRCWFLDAKIIIWHWTAKTHVFSAHTCCLSLNANHMDLPMYGRGARGSTQFR